MDALAEAFLKAIDLDKASDVAFLLRSSPIGQEESILKSAFIRAITRKSENSLCEIVRHTQFTQSQAVLDSQTLQDLAFQIGGDEGNVLYKMAYIKAYPHKI